MPRLPFDVHAHYNCKASSWSLQHLHRLVVFLCGYIGCILFLRLFFSCVVCVLATTSFIESNCNNDLNLQSARVCCCYRFTVNTSATMSSSSAPPLCWPATPSSSLCVCFCVCMCACKCVCVCASYIALTDLLLLSLHAHHREL